MYLKDILHVYYIHIHIYMDIYIYIYIDTLSTSDLSWLNMVWQMQVNDVLGEVL